MNNKGILIGIAVIGLAALGGILFYSAEREEPRPDSDAVAPIDGPTSSAPPAVPPPFDREIVKQQVMSTISFYKKMVETAEKHRDDCAAMGSALSQLIDEDAANMRRLSEHRESLPPDQARVFDEYVKSMGDSAMKTVQQRIKGSILSCASHPSVRKALESLARE